MRIAIGTMVVATLLLVACSGPQGPQDQRGRLAKKEQKATRVHQGRRVPQAAQAYGS